MVASEPRFREEIQSLPGSNAWRLPPQLRVCKTMIFVENDYMKYKETNTETERRQNSQLNILAKTFIWG